jgi:outer membrane biosynthesis protein TonB
MRALQAVILGLGLASVASWAQVATEPAKPAAAPVKADEVKKSEPRKPEPPKKPAPKKAEPKKPEPAKKPQPPKKPAAAPAPVSNDPNVKVYKAGAKDVPKLRDKDGNVIPTNPDAYDVSSATKK